MISLCFDLCFCFLAVLLYDFLWFFMFFNVFIYVFLCFLIKYTVFHQISLMLKCHCLFRVSVSVLLFLCWKNWFAKYWFPAKYINETTHSAKETMQTLSQQSKFACNPNTGPGYLSMNANLAHFASYVNGVGTTGKAWGKARALGSSNANQVTFDCVVKSQTSA